jgi:guanylate kinase
MSAPKRPGLLVVVSGPSGVGKTTVAERLRKLPGYGQAVTATTRAPRGGEKDGVDYHFLTDAAFRAGIARGEFLEHAEVHGRLYGTPRASVQAVLDRGLTCLLVIDVQGAATLRASSVEALYVFVAPPSDAELERRLRGRATDSEEAIARPSLPHGRSSPGAANTTRS